MDRYHIESNSGRTLLNNELIVFLRKVLQICDAIREQCGTFRNTRIEIKAVGKSDSVIYMGEEHDFAEQLLNFIFCHVKTGDSEFEVGHLGEKENTRRKIRFEQKQDGLEILSLPGYPVFSDIKNVLDALFLETKLVERFKEKISNFEGKLVDCQSQITESKVFLPRKQILEYLASYIEVLTFLIEHEEFINEKSGKARILKPLLNFCIIGENKDEERASASISVLSPVPSYLFLMIYARLEEYLEMDLKDTEEIREIYRDIFEKKVLHSFRWFLADEKHRLYHAAISPFVERDYKQSKLLIPVHSLNCYSSYEGIREMRLAEKIMFELEDFEPPYEVQGNQKWDYNVAIFGDLQKTPMEELTGYLTKLLEISDSHSSILKSVRICLHVYTKTEFSRQQDCRGEGKRYIYEFYKPQKILKDRNQMEQVLDAHDLIFILDSVDLYQDIYVEDFRDIDFCKQRLICYDRREMEEDIRESHDISFRGKFRELHECLTSYLYSGRWGLFRKDANELLLKYIEDYVNRSDKKAVYVYVSDLAAFRHIYCNDKYFVRREQYSEKEIGIIRYSKRAEPVLPNCQSKDNMIVFNAWQFVKHIIIDKRKKYLDALLPGIETQCDLKQVCIGIDYREWKNKLVLDYCMEKESLESPLVNQAVKEFIEKILLPILNDNKNTMYSVYLRKAISSFLYGDVADVEDMLFVYLFRNHGEQIGPVELSAKHVPARVRKNINRNFKYSFKRFYDMAFESYDISATEYFGQHRMIRAITTSEELRQALSETEIDKALTDKKTKERFFTQIVVACEWLGYTDSYLYHRCERELKR